MKVGMVSYATEQGLGYLAKSFYDAGVIDSVMLIYHGAIHARPTHVDWYSNITAHVHGRITKPNMKSFLDGLDVVIFFETPFDWELPGECRRRGIKTVMMPMYEWFPKGREGEFDLYLCPSNLDLDYFPRGILFRPPVDYVNWKVRTQAKRFLHNAGNVGHRWHKGTLELLQAMKYVVSDLKLTVRCQDAHEFGKVLDQVPEVIKDERVEIVKHAIPRDQLFTDHDVYVAPEKFNGLSLPLQEAYAAGLLVMTTNRYPANVLFSPYLVLPENPLIPVHSYYRAAIGGSYLEFDEAEVRPEDIAKTMDQWYGREITLYSLMGREWASNNSWAVRKPQLLKILEDLCQSS